MNYSFSTKYTYFAPEPDNAEAVCEVCGNTFETSKTQRNRAKYCPDCRDEATRNKQLENYKNHGVHSVTGDPVTNLVFAVCKQAKIDSDKGDRDAKQWLVTDMELWLRACGLSLKPSEIMRIRRMV